MDVPAQCGGFSFHSETVLQESQFVASLLFFVTIMALLICSNETNITTFHDPSLRNEGTNLQCDNRSVLWWMSPDQSTKFMLGSQNKHLPFVESRRPLFSQHGPGTVNSTLILAWWWVHVSSFYHIHWGGNHRGNKASAKRRYKVARQVVCGESSKILKLEGVCSLAAHQPC